MISGRQHVKGFLSSCCLGSSQVLGTVPDHPRPRTVSPASLTLQGCLCVNVASHACCSPARWEWRSSPRPRAGAGRACQIRSTGRRSRVLRLAGRDADGPGRARAAGAGSADAARAGRSRRVGQPRIAAAAAAAVTTRQRRRLAKASQLAPRSAAIERLLALAESRKGNLDASVRHWRRAIELDAADLKAPYALAQELERLGGPANDAEAQRLLEALAARSGNLAAQLEYARVAARRGDAAALRKALDALAQSAPSWPADAQERLTAVRRGGPGESRRRGDERHLPEERADPRAGVSRRVRRGQHATIRGRRTDGPADLAAESGSAARAADEQLAFWPTRRRRPRAGHGLGRRRVADRRRSTRARRRGAARAARSAPARPSRSRRARRSARPARTASRPPT